MNAKVVKLEQIGDNKIAIEKDSFEVIQAAVAVTAANIIIPDDVDRTTDKYAQLVAAVIATTTTLTIMALYAPEAFTEVMENSDTAEGIIKTMSKKGKEMFS